MRKVTSLDEYYALVKAAKRERLATVSNCFLFPSAIQRYIDLDRLYVEDSNAGIFILSDEDKFFYAYFYLNPDKEIHFEPREKPVVIQSVYNDGHKSAGLVGVEQRLTECGFVLADRMKQIKADPEKVLRKINPVCRHAKKLLDTEGFQFVRMREDLLPEVKKLLDRTPEIPYYQVPYFSAEELREQIDSGLFVGILTNDGRLCAAHQSFLEGKTIYGWLAVSPEYKELYGMGLICTQYEMEYAIEHGYGVSGWITETNVKSIQYHERIAFQTYDRCLDEWVLPQKIKA